MQDIIDILRQVWQGLDRLQVVGVSNAQLLGSCADGVNAAFKGLQKLQVQQEQQAAQRQRAVLDAAEREAQRQARKQEGKDG